MLVSMTIQNIVAGRLKKAKKTAIFIKNKDAIGLINCLTDELASEFSLIDKEFNKEAFLNNVRR